MAEFHPILSDECEALKKIFHDYESGINEDQISSIINNIIYGAHKKTNEVARKHNVEINWNNETYIQLLNSEFANIRVHLDENSPIGSNFLMKKLIEYKVAEAAGLELDPKYNPTKIAYLSPTELCKNLEGKIQGIVSHKADEVEENLSSMYVCRRCRNRSTRVEQIQTRSADEEQSLRITCVACGNRWIIK